MHLIKKKVKYLTEAEEKKTQEIEKPSKIRAFPQFFGYTNEEGTGYDLEVYLPGVEKDTLKVKMTREYIGVTGETETVRYIGTYAFCCPVEPDKATSKYKEGLLKVHVPFEEVTVHTIDIEVS